MSRPLTVTDIASQLQATLEAFKDKISKSGNSLTLVTRRGDTFTIPLAGAQSASKTTVTNR